METKFSIGYYQNNRWGDTIINVINDFPQINEVYFSLPDQPSGRPVLGNNCRDINEVEKRLHKDLKEIKRRGLKLTLLLNAACYGEQAASIKFINQIKSTVKLYSNEYKISSITTTSPIIAHAIKAEYKQDLEIRASINMRLGNIDALEYLKDIFDAFYIQRELYRNFDKLNEIRHWCDSYSKKIYGLANSGCFAYCPWQTTHDNLIAHSYNDGLAPDEVFVPNCFNYLKTKCDVLPIIKGCFIRPEDVEKFSSIFDGIKLASRTHFLPRLIAKAYCSKKFEGNLTDILEPGHNGVFKNYKINNHLFPNNWINKTINCKRDCSDCNFCETILNQVFIEDSSNTDYRKYLQT